MRGGGGRGCCAKISSHLHEKNTWHNRIELVLHFFSLDTKKFVESDVIASLNCAFWSQVDVISQQRLGPGAKTKEELSELVNE